MTDTEDLQFEKSMHLWEKNDFPLFSFLCDPDYNLLLIDFSEINLSEYGKNKSLDV